MAYHFLGVVLLFEIKAPGDARCAGRSLIGSGPPSYTAGKFLVVRALQCGPCLMIAGRGFEDEKYAGGNAGKLLGFEVVELDKPHVGAQRPHNQIELCRQSRRRAFAAWCG